MKIFKYAYSASALAVCLAAYSLVPAPGPQPVIPADLRDAPSSGSALQDLSETRGEGAPALLPPAAAIPEGVFAGPLLKDLSAPRREIISLARGYLEKAAGSEYVKRDAGLSSAYASMLETICGQKIQLRETGCAGRFENYVAYINGEHDSLKIFFCERFSYLPAGSVAQTVIHELSHVLLNTTEPEATRLETIATYLGGRTPELNGYNSEDFFEDLVGLDVERLRGRYLDYFYLMNARTPDAFRLLKLKTYAIYRNQKGVAYMLKRLCGSDEPCKLAALRQKDKFGVSVLDDLAASGIKDTGAFLSSKPSQSYQ